MAMAAFVMADMGHADTGLNARLFENRRGLPVYGLAFLLRAMAVAKGPAAQIATLRDELITHIQVKERIAMVKEIGDDRFRWEFMSSDVRSSAIALSALLLVAPDHAVVEQLVDGLKKTRRPSGAWYNTQDTLYSLVALSDFARRQAKGKASVEVALGATRLGRKKLDGNAAFVVERPLEKLQPGTLTLDADGRARYVVRLVTARRDVAPDAVEKGIAVSREYLALETGLPISDVKAGQLVRVKVRIRSQAERAWVALVDPIPAGFEAVNQKLATAARVNVPTSNAGRWWWHQWTHIELRDDRAQAFADRLSPGRDLELEYLVRATIPGSFTAAPARAEAMYDPDVHGRSVPRQIKVKP
jgi:uncharacterized protein YfaS (alpha-2-macroglobulin family)